MSAPIILAVVVRLVALPAYYIWFIVSNCSLARRIGLRTVIIPGDLTSPAWLLLGPCLAAFERWLTGGRNWLFRYGWLGSDFKEKASLHLEFSDAFMCATPGKNYLYLADSVAINHIFQTERRGDFFQPHKTVEMLPKGRTDGTIVALRLSRQILEHCLPCGDNGTDALVGISRQFALNVLKRTSFGKAYDFQAVLGSKDSSVTAPVSKSKFMDYRESLRLILENCILIVALGPKFLEKWGGINSKLSLLGHATSSFRHHLDAIYNESKLGGKQQELRANLMAYLVRSSGNMFIYAFAGHDTVAHALAFTLALLVAHPEDQDWMREELWEVLYDEREEWSYESFGKLKRVAAVQLETLRLFNPLVGAMKNANKTTPAQLPLNNGRPITLPAGTPIYFNFNGLHTHPKHWGPDAEEWRPSHWITTDKNCEEQQMVLEKGSFIP
ncbi:hypothetical protein QQZ08_007432 [Neonectria magnoliae]|uniref:Cytochrome P450 n=1 Tax=Neonectria magnoliae TaxID=2732573 RepID=A0ABR1HZA7_9HYPO